MVEQHSRGYMPFFTYNLNIPNGPNNPSNDQPLMQTNTNSISQLIDQDHYTFNNQNNINGLHKQVRMPDLVAIPPALALGEGTLYTKNVQTLLVPPTLESELFYTPDNTTQEYQLTRTITSNFATFGQNIPYGTTPATIIQKGGWTYLPGGMLYQYGSITSSTPGGPLNVAVGPIQFPVPFSSFVASIFLQLERDSPNQTINVNSLIPPTLTQFNFLTSSNGSIAIFWSAIGV